MCSLMTVLNDSSVLPKEYAWTWMCKLWWHLKSWSTWRILLTSDQILACSLCRRKIFFYPRPLVLRTSSWLEIYQRLIRINQTYQKLIIMLWICYAPNITRVSRDICSRQFFPLWVALWSSPWHGSGDHYDLCCGALILDHDLCPVMYSVITNKTAYILQ